MHFELVVPGLFSIGPQPPLPGLEVLLSRGRSRSGASRGLADWLHDAFQLGDQSLAAGALTVSAAGGEPRDAYWVRADPVHLKVTRDRALVLPAEALSVSVAEAVALCDALNRHFAGTLALEAVASTRWVARLAEPLVVAPESALERAGRELDLGAGAAGPAQRLLTEAQMILHDHPVNEAREARGEPALNSVWLWGGGRAPDVARSPWLTVLADDPLARGLARLGGARQDTLPPSANVWLERAAPEGRHLALLDALRLPGALSDAAAAREALATLERQWFAPLLAALRAGRAGMVTLHVPGAPKDACFETTRADLRRIWRRRRALEHYA